MRQHVMSIFFDGTSNGPKAENPSNVYKLYQMCEPFDEETDSYSLYLSGPGGKEYDVMCGNMAGVGIIENIKKAYRELAQFKKEVGDVEIALYGFSRGAFTVHVFCWLLAMCGIPEDFRYCDEAVDCFVKNPDEPDLGKIATKPVAKIAFAGVWDIVKSIIPNIKYHDEELPEIVENAYHGMSLDECRTKFPVMKWRENGTTKLTQIWFAGVHSDVGGGYKEAGLSNIALQWMCEAVAGAGLGCNVPEAIPTDCKQDLHDPFKDAPYWLVLGKAARVYEGEACHESVAERCKQVSDYKPKAENWNMA